MSGEKKNIIKILYIDPTVDEKSSSEMLEQSTMQLDCTCVFTVVPNAFLGLECTEHTFYDLIIAKKNLQHLQAIDMMKVLEMVGARTPFVLLIDRGEKMDTAEISSCSLFFDVLRKPFSTIDLCTIIESAMEETKSRLGGMNTNKSMYYNPLLRQPTSTHGNGVQTLLQQHNGSASNSGNRHRSVGTEQEEDVLADTFTSQSSISSHPTVTPCNNANADQSSATVSVTEAQERVSLNELHSMLRIYRNQVGTSNTGTPVGSNSAQASPKEIFQQQQGGQTEDFLAYQSLLLQQQAQHHRARLHKMISSTSKSSNKDMESGCTSHDSDASNGSNDVEFTHRMTGPYNEKFRNTIGSNKSGGSSEGNSKKRSSTEL